MIEMVYVYSRSRKDGHLIERCGAKEVYLNWNGGHMFYDIKNGRDAHHYMTNLAVNEGEVRGQTVWFYEPCPEKALEAFFEKEVEMAQFYASKCKRKTFSAINKEAHNA